jgi:hypothetical protein
LGLGDKRYVKTVQSQVRSDGSLSQERSKSCYLSSFSTGR